MRYARLGTVRDTAWKKGETLTITWQYDGRATGRVGFCRRRRRVCPDLAGG